MTNQSRVFAKDDMSREAREWRKSQGQICCNWQSYMVGDGCDICQPTRGWEYETPDESYHDYE